MKRLLKKIHHLFWAGFWGRVSLYRTGLYSIVKTSCQRNDDEIELKNRLDNPLYLERFGFKVYSQNDEDGIIEEIFNRIKTVGGEGEGGVTRHLLSSALKTALRVTAIICCTKDGKAYG